MMLIRPARLEDQDALFNLARLAGSGLTSLPSDRMQIAARIERSVHTFAGSMPLAEQGYLFVLEESVSRRVVGVSGIEVAVGLAQPWYSFRSSVANYVSAQLGINRFETELTLCNDHAGYSELCTLFLDPDWRHSRNGHLLSKARLLFLAAFKKRFAKKIVAEMRGVQDVNGKSPFWESIGRRFFEIDFSEADYLTGVGKKSFIADLMPRGPIYTSMLSPDVLAVIGKVHHQTEAARAMLESEGFRHEGYIDIFDGGATLEAYVDELRMVRSSSVLTIRSHHDALKFEDQNTSLYLVANELDQQFRATLTSGYCVNGSIYLSGLLIDALQLSPDAIVRVAPVYAEQC